MSVNTDYDFIGLDGRVGFKSFLTHWIEEPTIVQYILVYPALDYPAPRLTGRVSLLLKGEKAPSNKTPSFRFSAIVLMKVKLFNNLFC